MTTPKEITATEKLLDLIRTSSPAPITDTTGQQTTTEGPQSGLGLEEISFDNEQKESTESSNNPPEKPRPASAPPLPIATNTVNDDGPAPREAGRLEFPPLSSVRTKPPSFFQASTTALSLQLQRLRSSTKTTIAVDIQPGIIHLVKTQTDKHGHTLLACQSAPYPIDPDSKPKNLFDDPQFKAVLFTALSAMVGDHSHHEIWCSYFFCNPVAVHNISIPKVADKEIANAVFWSAKRELEFDVTTSLFDYSILQELTEGNQVKIQTLVTLVPRPEVQGVEAMFRNAGFPLTGLTFPAAAIQNFLNQDQAVPADKPVVYFTIRKHNSFIDLFYQGKMFFSREIKTGIDSFVESLLDYIYVPSSGVQIDEEKAKAFLFRSKDSVGNSKQAPDEIFSLVNLDELTVIDRLVRQLVRTFEYCNTTFRTPPVCKIFTSGEYTVNDAILKNIENRVDIQCAVMNPLSLEVFNRDLEKSVPNGSGLLVAAGLSLSNKQTTANFLYTYAERFAEATTNRINTIIAIATICLTISCGALFAWQYDQGLRKKTMLNTMQTELDNKYQKEPRSRSNDYTSLAIHKISQFHSDNKEKIKRFQAIAMVHELTRGIAKEINITDLTLDLTAKLNESKIKKNEPSNGAVQLKGYIKAPLETQEFILMNFLKTLADLNLFGEPDLKSKENTSLQDENILRFEVSLQTTLGLLESPSP